MKNTYILNALILMYIVNYLLCYEYFNKYYNISREKNRCFNFYATKDNNDIVEKICRPFKYDYVEFSLATSRMYSVYMLHNLFFVAFIIIIHSCV